jgi:hypothetical protein
MDEGTMRQMRSSLDTHRIAQQSRYMNAVLQQDNLKLKL